MSIRAQKNSNYGKFDGSGPGGAVYWKFSGCNCYPVQCGDFIGGSVAGRV